MDKIIVSHKMKVYDTNNHLSLVKVCNDQLDFCLPLQCFNFSFTLNSQILYEVKEEWDGTRYFIVSLIKDI